jgi:hypothetical protein
LFKFSLGNNKAPSQKIKVTVKIAKIFINRIVMALQTFYIISLTSRYGSIKRVTTGVPLYTASIKEIEKLA